MRERTSDIELTQKIMAELDAEPGVDASGLAVTVKDGIAMLTGHVPGYAQRRAAVQAVERTAVRGVVEDVEVRLPSSRMRPDADLVKAVLNAIQRHVFLPGGRLEVEVEDGVVTLGGEVEWPYQRDRALEIARPLTGVRRIIDCVSVTRPASPAVIDGQAGRSLGRAAPSP